MKKKTNLFILSIVFMFTLLFFLFEISEVRVRAYGNQDYISNEIKEYPEKIKSIDGVNLGLFNEGNIGLNQFDVVTYDISGNENYYRNDDIAYLEQVDIQEYNNQTRDEEGDEDSPYLMYYEWPYSSICIVLTTYDINNDGFGDITYIGSGTMVGHDTMMTSAENVYNIDYGNPLNVEVMPGAYTNENNILIKPFGQSNMVSCSRGVYESTLDANDNWAIVRLAESIGYDSGWLSVSYDSINNGSSIKTIGYTYYNCEYAINSFTGIVSSLETYKFNHSDVPPTSLNGAPVLDVDNKVCGVQSGPRVVINDVVYSQACKVSVYIKNWIQEAGGLLEFRIFSDLSGNSSLINLGHAWLSIKNNSPWVIKIGKMFLLQNQYITIGTWQSNGDRPHSGIFYN